MKKEKRRKSYITIMIVILMIILIATLCINLYKKKEYLSKKVNPTEYYSNLLEEDFMRYEYSKINKELNGLCAFAINNDKLVGVKENGEFIDIYTINSEISYDYVYNAQKLYLLEKESGLINIIPLKTEGEYIIESKIELGKSIEQIQVYNNDIYYLSDKTLYKYNGESSDIVFENIENDYFVIKQDYLYIINQGNLLKISMDTKEQIIIASNVTNIEYFNFYERNKLVFEVCEDGENKFKKIYSYYNGEINNSIKNNGYFIPYGSNEYVYINNDKSKLFLIDNNGSSKMLYSSNSEINEAEFIKSKYIMIKDGEENILINLESRKVEENNIENIDNIKYIK